MLLRTSWTATETTQFFFNVSGSCTLCSRSIQLQRIALAAVLVYGLVSNLFVCFRHTHDKRYDKALGIYLKLKHKDVFDLIHRHNLFDSISDKIVLLMEFDPEAAVKMLLLNREKVPVSSTWKTRNIDLSNCTFQRVHQSCHHCGTTDISFHCLQIEKVVKQLEKSQDLLHIVSAELRKRKEFRKESSVGHDPCGWC